MNNPPIINGYSISTENNLLDTEKILLLLNDCFWSKNIPIEYINRFIKFSLCFGVYHGTTSELVGFARVISDYTTYAYLCDVVIDKKHRNKGLGNQLITEIMSHPDLQGLKTWSLRTTPAAQNIYFNHGFYVTDHPEIQLEINDLDIYSHPNFNNLHKEKHCHNE